MIKSYLTINSQADVPNLASKEMLETKISLFQHFSTPGAVNISRPASQPHTNVSHRHPRKSRLVMYV